MSHKKENRKTTLITMNAYNDILYIEGSEGIWYFTLVPVKFISGYRNNRM